LGFSTVHVGNDAIGGWILDPGHSTSNADCWRFLNELTDESLVLRLIEGEQDALAVLFDRYHRLVFSVAARIVEDPGEAEEVVQTVFLDFYRGLARYDANKGILRVWLLQYAYHRALNRRRHLAASRFYKWVDLDSASAEPSLSWNPSDVAEIARLMDQLLNSLSPRRRQVVELTYFEGLTADEIAIRLGQSVNIVRHELYRSLAQLHKLVLQEGHAAADGATQIQTGALRADA
jgi:RNA polymerase sigma-70 factor (ECF subfamily)